MSLSAELSESALAAHKKALTKTDSWDERCNFLFSNKQILCMRWSATGDFLAVGDKTGVISVFKSAALLNTGSSSRSEGPLRLTEHTSEVRCLAWHPKKHSVLSSVSEDKTVRMWDLSDAAKKRIPFHIINTITAVTRIIWRPDGAAMAIADKDNAVRLVDGEKRTEITMCKMAERICDLRFSKCGTLLIAATKDGKVTALCGKTLSTLRQWTADTGGCLSVALDSSESLLAVGGQSGVASMWRTADLSCVYALCPALKRRKQQRENVASIMGDDSSSAVASSSRLGGALKAMPGADVASVSAAISDVAFNSDSTLFSCTSVLNTSAPASYDTSSQRPFTYESYVDFVSPAAMRFTKPLVFERGQIQALDWHPSKSDVLAVCVDMPNMDKIVCRLFVYKSKA